MKIVVKIGSNILSEGARGINRRRIGSITRSVVELRDMGIEVVLVSSGAIAAGMKKLGLKARPRDVKLKQAVAAVGQSSLMETYEKSFSGRGLHTAQILLTRDGLADREMYINAKNTILTLLSYAVVPIVNENDSVATEEIKFGDNDQLAALVSMLVEAERLVILSDVDGLYDSDPSSKKTAKLIPVVEDITEDVVCLAGGSGSIVSTGGMYSKVIAAKKAVRSGITVNIINGRRPSQLVSLMKGKAHGTEFRPHKVKLTARKGWIAYGIKAKGSIVLDKGAVKALVEHRKSLLPSGIA
ncbi:hypothetical protein LCGC14_3007930, partial [marine sediment metagenome]